MCAFWPSTGEDSTLRSTRKALRHPLPSIARPPAPLATPLPSIARSTSPPAPSADHHWVRGADSGAAPQRQQPPPSTPGGAAAPAAAQGARGAGALPRCDGADGADGEGRGGLLAAPRAPAAAHACGHTQHARSLTQTHAHANTHHVPAAVRMVEDDVSTVPFSDAYDTHCARYGREPDAPILAFKVCAMHCTAITSLLAGLPLLALKAPARLEAPSHHCAHKRGRHEGETNKPTLNPYTHTHTYGPRVGGLLHLPLRPPIPLPPLAPCPFPGALLHTRGHHRRRAGPPGGVPGGGGAGGHREHLLPVHV